MIEEHERHTDPIDTGSQTAANFLADTLNSIQRLVPKERAKTFDDYEPTDDDLTCETCETPNSIPPQRAFRGYTSCVYCIDELEHRSKSFVVKMRRNDYD